MLWVFPVTVSLVTGLGSADPEAIALMRSYRASGRQIFRFVQFPASLPYLFAGLQIAVTYSVIAAAVFSDSSGRSRVWVGSWSRATSERNIDLTMAAILITSAIALVGYLLVWLLARRSMPWRRTGRA